MKELDHIHVSSKCMDWFLGKSAFRSNHRAMGNAMFDLFDQTRDARWSFSWSAGPTPHHSS